MTNNIVFNIYTQVNQYTDNGILPTTALSLNSRNKKTALVLRVRFIIVMYVDRVYMGLALLHIQTA